MNNQQFLEGYPIELSVPAEILPVVRVTARLCNERYPMIFREGLPVEGFVTCTIRCTKTSFAMGYWYFGLEYQKRVVPLLEKYWDLREIERKAKAIVDG